MKQKQNILFPLRLPLAAVGFAFWCLYLLGILFPETWWGTHFLAFLPAVAKWGLLGLSLVLISAPLWMKEEAKLPLPVKTNIPLWLAVVALCGLMLAFFLAFPVFQDVYGDAPRNLKSLALEGNELFPERYKLIFSPNIFNTTNGEITVLNSMEYLIKTNEWEAVKAFSVMDALFGLGFVLVSGLYLFKAFRNPGSRLMWVIVLIASPFLLNFMGKVEIYAPILFFLALYVYGQDQALQKQNKQGLLLAFVLLLLAAKFHGTSFLLVPGFLLLLGYVLMKDKEKRDGIFTWKKIGLWVLASTLVLGIILYFGIVGDHNDPRFITPEIDPSERIFLPLISPEAPLDNYNLLSLNHLLDYLNNVLLWSPPALFLLVFAFGFLRKHINWNEPAVLLTGLTFILYFLFFFTINPLLSLPMDWDLTSIPGVLLLFWVISIYRQLAGKLHFGHMLAPVAGIALLTLSFFYVNANRDPLAQRMQVTGNHVFKTYWQRSVDPFRRIIELYRDAPQKAVPLLQQSIEQLKPYALTSQDWEYAELNRTLAAHFRKTLQNPGEAENYHIACLRYNPESLTNHMGLMEAYYLNGKKREAFETSLFLASKQYPNPQRSLLFVIDLGLDFGYFDELIPYTSQYLKISPGDEKMSFIHKSLQKKSDLSQLSNIFRGK